MQIKFERDGTRFGKSVYTASVQFEDQKVPVATIEETRCNKCSIWEIFAPRENDGEVKVSRYINTRTYFNDAKREVRQLVFELLKRNRLNLAAVRL